MHEHPLRRGGVHLLRQGTEADPALLQGRDDPDKMGEGAAQRSNFQTTSTSPERRSAKHAFRPSRSSRAPDARS